MSDDDSMLLNFTTNDDATGSSYKQAARVTGGRWKDRRRMKMKLEGKTASKKRRSNSTGEQGSVPGRGGNSNRKIHKDNVTRSEDQEKLA